MNDFGMTPNGIMFDYSMTKNQTLTESANLNRIDIENDFTETINAIRGIIDGLECDPANVKLCVLNMNRALNKLLRVVYSKTGEYLMLVQNFNTEIGKFSYCKPKLLSIKEMLLEKGIDLKRVAGKYVGASEEFTSAMDRFRNNGEAKAVLTIPTGDMLETTKDHFDLLRCIDSEYMGSCTDKFRLCDDIFNGVSRRSKDIFIRLYNIECEADDLSDEKLTSLLGACYHDIESLVAKCIGFLVANAADAITAMYRHDTISLICLQTDDIVAAATKE